MLTTPSSNPPRGAPNRWLHLRHPDSFNAEMYALFLCHTRIWRAYVEALLLEWPQMPQHFGTPAPAYEFYPPELSHDRTVASLPLGGPWTLGSRAAIEDGCSHLLWQYFPVPFLFGLDEGLTESTFADPSQLQTNWRKATRAQRR